MNGAFRSMFYTGAILVAATSAAIAQPSGNERWIFGNGGMSDPSAWVTVDAGGGIEATLTIHCNGGSPRAEISIRPSASSDQFAYTASLGESVLVHTYQDGGRTAEFRAAEYGMGEVLDRETLVSLQAAEFIRTSGRHPMTLSARGSAAAIGQLLRECPIPETGM